MTAQQLAVLHTQVAIPGLAVCLWCGEEWPCGRRRWADSVLTAQGGA